MPGACRTVAFSSGFRNMLLHDSQPVHSAVTLHGVSLSHLAPSCLWGAELEENDVLPSGVSSWQPGSLA